VLISSRVKNAEQLAAATQDDVDAIVFNWATWSLDDIITAMNRRLEGSSIEGIALVSHNTKVCALTSKKTAPGNTPAKGAFVCCLIVRRTSGRKNLSCSRRPDTFGFNRLIRGVSHVRKRNSPYKCSRFAGQAGLKQNIVRPQPFSCDHACN
jgi:hypothetical protein